MNALLVGGLRSLSAFLVSIILWDLYTNTTDGTFYPEKPNQMVEWMKSPKEMLPSSPAVVPSPEVQKESTTEESIQEISVAVPPPPSLTESQGQFNADFLYHIPSKCKERKKIILYHLSSSRSRRGVTAFGRGT